MIAITRTVWEGTDYVPSAWDDWIRDPNGFLMVACDDGEVVGLQHIEIQEDATAWIEGIRVAERARNRGVGEALLGYGLQWSRDMGCRVARLSTSSGNPSSNRLVAKAGMRVVGSWTPLAVRRPAARRQVESISPALAGEADAVYRHLVASSSISQTRLYTEGWTAHTLSVQRLRLLCALGCVLVVRHHGHIAGATIATCAKPFQYLRVGALTGDTATLSSLIQYVLGRAQDTALEEVRATLHLNGGAQQALEDVGFRQWHTDLMLVHETHLSGVSPASASSRAGRDVYSRTPACPTEPSPV